VHETCESVAILDQLTDKEREVLDLVAQRHTTKEIARQLGLSINAVDLRISKAREKLGAGDRNEAIRIYAHLLDDWGKTTGGSSPVSRLFPPPLATPPEQPGPRFTLRDAASFSLPAPWEVDRPEKLPEVLDRRFGRLWRVIAIPVGALCMALLALAMIAIAETLGMLI